MKLKDLLALAFLAVVLVVIGSFMVSKLGRQGQPRQATVEVVRPIVPSFNDEAQRILRNQDEQQKAQSFTPAVNLTEGLGNNSPFGP